MATQFQVPTRAEVSPANQAIFDNLEKALGFVPNLYATYAYSPTALGDYLALQNRKSSLKTREREVINLVVSQVNDCAYCLAAHTALGKLNGFTDEQILDIRAGQVTFDERIAALATFVRETTVNRGLPTPAATEAFFAAGFTRENLVDTIVVIGDKTISNFLHRVTDVPVDFPAAQPLELATA